MRDEKLRRSYCGQSDPFGFPPNKHFSMKHSEKRRSASAFPMMSLVFWHPHRVENAVLTTKFHPVFVRHIIFLSLV